MTDPNSLPYRPCVGIMLLNRENRIWIGERIPKPHDEHRIQFAWQMPQGGIDEGEDIERAARRELYEETGTDNVEIISRTSSWLTYDLPPDLVGKALKGNYRGQKQIWFAMRHTGSDDDFDISGKLTGHKPEFRSWKWSTPAEMQSMIVPFKRDVYRQVFDEFDGLINQGAEYQKQS